MGLALKELMIRIQLEREVDELLHKAEEKDSKIINLFSDKHV
jgi:hypothetical protein